MNQTQTPINLSQLPAATAAGYLTPINGATVFGSAAAPAPAKAPASAVITSLPAAKQVQAATTYFNEQQKADAMRKAQADYERMAREQQAAKASADAAKRASSASLATDVLSGFVSSGGTGEKGKLSAFDDARVQEITKISEQLAGLSTQMDARAGEQIASVVREYEAMAEQQKVANAQYEGGTSTAGLSSGRSRYAPEIQAGVQSAAVNSGIRALSDLQTKKQRLVMEIEAARDERKYKVLSARVEELKTLRKDEREAAQQMAENFYREQTYIRENSDFIGKNLAPTISRMLTGVPDQDAAILEDVARQNQISPAILMRYVDDYKSAEQKAKPNDMVMYELSKSQGFKGTWLDFQKAQKASGGGGDSLGTISISDAKAYGLPASMVGTSEKALLSSIQSDAPAPWYVQMAKVQNDGIAPSESALQSSWNQFRAQAVGGDSGGF